MNRSRSDIFSGAGVLLFAVAVHLAARGFERRIPMGVDSGYFPELASGFLAFLAILMIARGAIGLRRSHGPGPETRDPDAFQAAARVLGSLVAIVAYGLSIPYLGFILATFLFLNVSFAVLPTVGPTRWLRNALIAALLTATIYGIFTYGFGVILPRGPF